MFKKLLLFSFFLITACGNTQNSETKTFEVREGDTIRSVTTRLLDEKIVDNEFLLRIFAKITGRESQLKIGSYLIPPQSSYSDLLDILISGKGIGILITIPEGFNIFQIAVVLEDNEIVSVQDFLTEVYQNSWLKQFQIPLNPSVSISNIQRIEDQNGYVYAIPSDPPLYSLEGYLFPDTYSFEKEISARTVIQSMTKRFHQVVDNTILAEIKSQNKTLHEVIILASIIQKEATNEEEMPAVSGVYNNRLAINMILQADPTLIYALLLDGEYKGNIKTKHLRPPWSSPYNTYYIKTLPIGAIANPGKEAILAALSPDLHDYFYFVGSPNGKHKFSRTLTEHEKAVQEWVRHRRNR